MTRSREEREYENRHLHAVSYAVWDKEFETLLLEECIPWLKQAWRAYLEKREPAPRWEMSHRTNELAFSLREATKWPRRTRAGQWHQWKETLQEKLKEVENLRRQVQGDHSSKEELQTRAVRSELMMLEERLRETCQKIQTGETPTRKLIYRNQSYMNSVAENLEWTLAEKVIPWLHRIECVTQAHGELMRPSCQTAILMNELEKGMKIRVLEQGQRERLTNLTIDGEVLVEGLLRYLPAKEESRTWDSDESITLEVLRTNLKRIKGQL
jgi:hypothetical protein